MSRKIVIGVAMALVLLAVFIPLSILESRRTPDWQSELSRYLEISGIAQDVQRVQVAEAQYPGQFSAQKLKAVPVSWVWQGITRIPLPTAIHCVRIKGRDEAGSANLLVGYHNDGLWRAGWLVHEFQKGVNETEQQDILAKLGCTTWVEISVQMLDEP